MGLKRIVGLDFDGTLVENRFPDIGEVLESMQIRIQKEIDKYGEDNVDFILWTCRSGRYLKEAKKFIEDSNLPVKYFNESHPQVLDWDGWECSEKIFCNVYYDDRARNPILEDKIIDRLDEISSMIDNDKLSDELYKLSKDIMEGDLLE